jgi:hypothetical protein
MWNVERIIWRWSEIKKWWVRIPTKIRTIGRWLLFLNLFFNSQSIEKPIPTIFSLREIQSNKTSFIFHKKKETLKMNCKFCFRDSFFYAKFSEHFYYFAWFLKRSEEWNLLWFLSFIGIVEFSGYSQWMIKWMRGMGSNPKK